MRPTCTLQTWAHTVRPAMSTETLRARRGGPRRRRRGRRPTTRDAAGASLAGHHRPDGQRAEVVHAVFLVLPALVVELLR